MIAENHDNGYRSNLSNHLRYGKRAYPVAWLVKLTVSVTVLQYYKVFDRRSMSQNRTYGPFDAIQLVMHQSERIPLFLHLGRLRFTFRNNVCALCKDNIHLSHKYIVYLIAPIIY